MDPIEAHRVRYRKPATRMTLLAHLFGIIATVLLIVWLLHYREGIDLDSGSASRIFNVHPFLMFFGFIFMAGEERFDPTLSVSPSLTLRRRFIESRFRASNFTSTIDRFLAKAFVALPWLIGLSVFLLPGASHESRAQVASWHVTGGRILLFMAICAALTGLTEKATVMGLQHQSEARTINFLGLSILLFGILVDLSVSLGRYL
ncbi:UNVERIFIED_CONTAM: putative transmembrane ascorbate ferrireductase 3 [Sesamum latifolium]|uniref:Transmembrane ascorbate ferrireductase 3 n=1 Tax=Sesamum latifolium TaxID=2727402 RepID=A0AAW2WZ21_9LAMI